MMELDLSILKANLTLDQRVALAASLMHDALWERRSHGIDMGAVNAETQQLMGITIAYTGPHALELQKLFHAFMAEKHNTLPCDRSSRE